MCGINGIFARGDDAPPVDLDELLRTRDRMTARGPDSCGSWSSADRRVGLAHRRLAIIDLSADGAQPMSSADGRYQIVFNGEIYNYLDIKRRLELGGARFRSRSDTEVLLQLYANKGPDMCRELRGMFAFAIWDSLEQSLFLARDAFGIKPLYLRDDGRTLRFASQVKALLAGAAVPPAVDAEAERDYWIWGHVREPRTLYSGVLALGAGSWCKYRRGDGKVTRGEFDSVESMLQGESPPAHDYQNLREALLDSVRQHLIADVPVGVFLSSGVDSTTLAALVAECGGALRTLTLGFHEYRGTAADETPLAEQVAAKYGAEHHTVWIRREAFTDAYDEFMSAMDQPSIDGLNIWLVSKAASQVGIKVAISGLGGDELFGGYPSFHQLPRIRRLARPFAAAPRMARMLRRMAVPLLRPFTSEKYAGLLEYGHDWEGAYLLRRAVRMPWELPARTQATPIDSRASFEGDAHGTVSWLESSRYMRDQLLRDADWASMAHSIELRVPLVDAELARYVSQQRRAGRILTKSDLAAAALPALPEAVVSRPKTGFTVPVRDWIRRPQDTGEATQERGLRGWQRMVLSHATTASARP